jgi:hypothetical protein
MEAENDVRNRIVIQAPEIKPINVKHMAEENDVMNRIVIQVRKVNQINVLHMEVEFDVRIVSIGLIQDVVQ